MQYIYYIRSYQKFPSVIPVLRVSPLRVTHPSAMVPNIASYIFPINLHVLSILSAFILSQDQTLHSIYFSHIFFFSPFFRPLTEIFLYHSKPLRIFASSCYSVSHCPRLPLRLTKIILPNLFPFVNTFFYLFFLFFYPPFYSFILSLLPIRTIYLLLFPSQILYIVSFLSYLSFVFFFCRFSIQIIYIFFNRNVFSIFFVF